MPSKNHNFQSYRPDSSSGLPVLQGTLRSHWNPRRSVLPIAKSLRPTASDGSFLLSHWSFRMLYPTACRNDPVPYWSVSDLRKPKMTDHRLRPHLHPADPSDCPDCCWYLPWIWIAYPDCFLHSFHSRISHLQDCPHFLLPVCPALPYSGLLCRMHLSERMPCSVTDS